MLPMKKTAMHLSMIILYAQGGVQKGGELWPNVIKDSQKVSKKLKVFQLGVVPYQPDDSG